MKGTVRETNGIGHLILKLREKEKSQRETPQTAQAQKGEKQQP